MRTHSDSAHWRDSARFPRLIWFIDARAAFPILLALIHLRVWTISVALFIVFFLSILHHYGFTVEVFGRWLKSLLAGSRKIAVPWWLR